MKNLLLISAILIHIPIFAQNKARIKNIIVQNDYENDKILIINYDIEKSYYNERYLVNISFWDEYSLKLIEPNSECVTKANNSIPIKGGKSKRIIWDINCEYFSYLHDGFFTIDLITLPKSMSKKQIQIEKIVNKRRKLLARINKKKGKGLINIWRKFRYKRISARIERKGKKLQIKIADIY